MLTDSDNRPDSKPGSKSKPGFEESARSADAFLRWRGFDVAPIIDVIEISWKYMGKEYSVRCNKTRDTKIEYNGDNKQLTLYNITGVVAGSLLDITSMVRINACEVRLVNVDVPNCLPPPAVS